MVDWLGDFFKKEKPLVDYRSFNVTVQGASHIKANKVCQDFSGSVDGEKYKIAIICDGHGGDDYFRSELGSKFATEAALECLQDQDFLSFIIKNRDASEKVIDAAILQLEKSIIAMWNQKVYDHFEENPITPEELEKVSEKARKRYLAGERTESIYGTTIIAALLIKDFWFAIQLGDGKCVMLSSSGEWIHPIPQNEKCFLNQTTSMCDKDALDNFRHCFGNELPGAIFVGSDGVDDSFGYEDMAALNSFYGVVLTSFGTQIFEAAVEGLKDYLPRLSARGSGDDISIAGIINTSVATAMAERREESKNSEGADETKATEEIVESSEVEPKEEVHNTESEETLKED